MKKVLNTRMDRKPDSDLADNFWHLLPKAGPSERTAPARRRAFRQHREVLHVRDVLLDIDLEGERFAAQLPESYKRYLVNGLREAFDMPGVPIRLIVKADENPYHERNRTGRQRRTPNNKRD